MVLALWTMPVATRDGAPLCVITGWTLDIQLAGFRSATAKNGAESFQMTRKCGLTVFTNIFIVVLIYKRSHFHTYTPSMLIFRVLTSSFMVCQLSFSVILVK
jgi:hypothetical protein